MDTFFQVRLADRVIGIHAMHEDIRRMCRDYLAEGAPELTAAASQADIDHERRRSEREAALEGHAPIPYTDAYLETLAVYRQIAVGLLPSDTLLFHGSVIAVDGVGYLFTAKSGTGKSTHTKLWRDLFGSRAVMVNDDKPLLKITDRGVIAYGTPWDGKHHLSTNTAVPLRAICILARSPVNHIHAADKKDIYPMLCQQSFRPSTPEEMRKTMSLIDRLSNAVPFYRLGCNMEPEAAQIAYEGMNP